MSVKASYWFQIKARGWEIPYQGFSEVLNVSFLDFSEACIWVSSRRPQKFSSPLHGSGKFPYGFEVLRQKFCTTKICAILAKTMFSRGTNKQINILTKSIVVRCHFWSTRQQDYKILIPSPPALSRNNIMKICLLIFFSFDKLILFGREGGGWGDKWPLTRFFLVFLL